MLKLVTHVKETTQIKWNRIHKFKPSISLHIEMGPYIIKTADSVDDLLKAFRLRYDVFHREFREVLAPASMWINMTAPLIIYSFSTRHQINWWALTVCAAHNK